MQPEVVVRVLLAIFMLKAGQARKFPPMCLRMRGNSAVVLVTKRRILANLNQGLKLAAQTFAKDVKQLSCWAG
jgi:hypothetical protein